MLKNWDFPNEIFFHIGLYLNRRQLRNSSLVCKSWNAAFEPQVWSHIELGSNSRIIQLTLQELSSKASCIRALDFMDCESTIRFSLIGKGCTQLRALAIAIAPEDAARGKKYWSACEELIREIPTTLETLTFRLMPILGPEFEGDSFDWTLLLNIAHYLLRNLRALRLQYCQLPHHYIDAFLDICEQLQVSELQDVPFELPQLPTTGEPQSVNKRVVRLSNLLELTLVNSGPMDFLAQLEMIVRQAPKLKKLCWEVQRFLEARFRVNGFMYLFSGQAKYQHTPAPEDSRVVSLALCTAPCWPDLESLALKGNFHLLSSEQYLKIVEMSKTFRALDMPMYPMRSTIVDSIVRLHSRTLTEIVWNAPHEHNDVAWVQQILSSCPRLVKGYFRGILAQDIVVGGDSWVCCDSLEELRLNIIMGRPLDITYQDMAKAVFKQLARLHRLRILDMDSSMNHPLLLLQFTKSMGLTLLSTLAELEVLRLPWKPNLMPQDIDWMMEHWKSLRIVDGMRLTKSRSRFASSPNFWNRALATRLNRHGVETPGNVCSNEERLDCEELDWEFYPHTDNQIQANPMDELDLNIFQL